MCSRQSPRRPRDTYLAHLIVELVLPVAKTKYGVSQCCKRFVCLGARVLDPRCKVHRAVRRVALSECGHEEERVAAANPILFDSALECFEVNGDGADAFFAARILELFGVLFRRACLAPEVYAQERLLGRRDEEAAGECT